MIITKLGDEKMVEFIQNIDESRELMVSLGAKYFAYSKLLSCEGSEEYSICDVIEYYFNSENIQIGYYSQVSQTINLKKIELSKLQLENLVGKQYLID